MTATTRTSSSQRHKVVIGSVLFCVGAALLSACSSGGTTATSASPGGSSPSAAPSTSAAESGAPLVVGSDLTYPPYDSLSGSTPIGFDPELVSALSAAMRRTITITDTRFEQLIPSLVSGHIDLIASALYITAERAKVVSYIPYFSTGNSIVIRGGSAPLIDAKALCGKRVGVIKGGDIVKRLRVDASAACTASGAAAVDVREFTTDPEATQALISGQVDAQVTDAAVASELGSKTNGKVTISSTSLLYPIPVGLAVKKGNTALHDALAAALKQMQADGSYDKLLAKYNLKPVDQAQVSAILGVG